MRLEEKLVQLRKEKGLTQLQAANELDVSRQAISKWESGSAVPSIENLKLLSELYGVPADYLLNDGIEHSNQTETPEENRTKEKLPAKKTKRYAVFAIIAVCMLTFTAVIWMIYRGVASKNSGNRHFSEMESDNWENENIEGFSFTW